MQSITNKRDFHFKDVEKKHKGDTINNENIRNLLKILFFEEKIEIITKCVKDIEKIKKINNEDKKTQKIDKLKNKYKFLSDITDEEIENCDNEESILGFIFKYYLKQFENNKNNLENRRNYFKAYKKIIEYDKENIEKYEYYIYFTIEILNIEELVEFKNFIKAINNEKNNINLTFAKEHIIEKCCSLLLNEYESDKNYLKIIEENLKDIIQYCEEDEDKIKLLEILSELVKTECETNDPVNQITLFNNLLNKNPNIKIKEYKKDLYSLYFENFKSKKSTNGTEIGNLKEIINYLEFSTIKEFIDYIKEEEVNENVEIIKKCLYSAYFEKLPLENNFLQLDIENCKELINILETNKYNNLKDITKIKKCLYIAYFEKLPLKNIFLRQSDINNCNELINILEKEKYNDFTKIKECLYSAYFKKLSLENNFLQLDIENCKELINILETNKYNNLNDITKIKECLYGAYFDKLNAYFDKLNIKEIIEDEFSKLELNNYKKLIKVLETEKYNNLKNIIKIKGKLYFYYIKKMKEEKYGNEKIENFIKNYISNYSLIYINVLTYLKEEIIKNKQEGNFLTILTDNIDTISKIIKYTFSSFKTIENIIKDEKINKDEGALKTIYKILSLNITKEEENKKEKLLHISKEKNKKEEFLKNFASILRMKVNIDNKECILAEVCDPKKSLSNDFKKIKENLKEIQDFQIFREFYFNDEKNKVNDEKNKEYKNPEKLSVQSEKIIISKTKEDNTDIQNSSSPSKPENTNNHEQNSQSKRTNTHTID